MTPTAIIKYVIIAGLGFWVTHLLTPLVIRLALKFGLVDQPDERRIHTIPTPRGGGLAVMAGFNVVCAAIFLFPWGGLATSLSCTWWLKLLCPTLLLLGLGLWDDCCDIKPLLKLAGQILVGTVAFYCGLRLDGLLGVTLPGWVSYLATVFWFVAVMNAFNLIDGMDGLAAGLGLISAVGMAGIFFILNLPGNALVMLGLTGSCLAFLRYNFHPARIFLGDTGSLFIGFVLAAVALSSNAKGLTLATIAAPILAIGIPLFDTLLAIWRRVVRKILHKLSPPNETDPGNRKLFGADLEHLHHRLLRHGLTQKTVALYLYVVSIILVTVGLLGLIYRGAAVGLYVLAFAAATYVTIKHIAHVELWHSAMALAHGVNRPRIRHLTVPLYMLGDVALLMLAHTAANLLFMPNLSHDAIRQLLLQISPIHVSLPFLCLVTGRMYSRVWSRAQAMDYVLLTWWLLTGAVLSFGMKQLLRPGEAGDELLESLLFFGFSAGLLAGIRVFPRLALECLAYMGRWYDPHHRPRHKVLIYGAGVQGALFLKAEGRRVWEEENRLEILGFIDDDSNLVGRLVCGYKVISSLATLEMLLGKLQVERIVLTTALPPSSLMRLRQLAAAHHIHLFTWLTTLALLDARGVTRSVPDSGPALQCLPQPLPGLEPLAIKHPAE